jgi:uncharacterized membrane protein
MVSKYHWKKDGARFLILRILLLIVIIAVVPASAQEQEGYNSESLFIALFATGDALVEHNVGIENPLAEEIRIKLFGQDISDLIVVDLVDNVIQFETGETPNEIVLHRPNASNLKISYTTSDFLSKDRREWIFTLNSTISFSVKLPPDSILTDPGENPSIVLVGDQQLLTYRPGNIRFVYVIGALGTEEQANIVIRAAETTIVQINNSYPGIVLTSANDLLQRATDARDGGRFTDAERLADQANDAAIATGRDYDAAQQALTNAEAQINRAGASGGNNDAAARQMLEQANDEFASGNYVEARNAAEDVVTSIDDQSAPPEMPLSLIIAAAAAGAVGLGTMVFLRMRKHQNSVPRLEKGGGGGEEPKISANDNSKAAGLFRPTTPPVAEVEREQEGEVEEHQDMTESREETRIHQIPSTISDSLIDRSVLARIVGKILEERPHLRPEDQQVLKFLVEKEGAAFESEIRSEFQLPKTTIWRLVKRLEREELVEIRKAGGQNLIKLRFEDKQA